MPSVGDTPVKIGTGPQLIRNMGPDDLYLGGADVSEENGYPLHSGQSISMLHGDKAGYAISTGTSDVRLMPGGSGVFSDPAA
jgi:hypothetical protein